MRLFLLPISTKRSLIYCQRLNKILSNELTYADKLTTRANAIWTRWENSDKGWQKRVTGFGDKLFKRIPFEEWGLKSIPPLSARRKDQELQGKDQVEVTFAPSLTKSESVLDTLRNLATERKALHKKYMWGSIAIMPLTIPFGLIPIIPNLPFFYLVFRAWSHWRALSGSQHIDFLLKNNLIKLSPSWVLDATYGAANTETSAESPDEKARISTTSPINKPDQDIPKTNSNEKMLLGLKDGKMIAEILTLPEVEVEIERAVHQVEESLAAEQELREEAKDLDSASNEIKSK